MKANSPIWHPDMPEHYKNQVIAGDARILTRDIPDKSIDLIFTDPPYHKKYLYLYLWLAEAAARVLKDSGFLLTYSGGCWKNIVFRHLGRHLAYFWDYTMLMSGNASIIWPRKTISRGKALLAYHKADHKPLPRVNVIGVWKGGGEDKNFHEWGQDEDTARYYIDCFSDVGDVVLDPLCGGGTTLVSCKILNRNFIAFDIDEKAVETTQRRLEEFRFTPYQDQLFQPEEQLSFPIELDNEHPLMV